MDLFGLVSALISGGAITAAISAYINRKKFSLDIRKIRAEGIQLEDEIFMRRIEFYKRENAEQLKIIEEFREKHPDNGEELDAWERREEQLLQRQYIMEKEIFELAGHLKFTLKELELCQNKKK